MATLHLLRYNNYYNRKVLGREYQLSDYLDKGDLVTTIQQGNFNPGDGVNASAIVNYNDNDPPNYMVYANDDNEIVSRWYVIDANRTRAGQYNLTLRRDVVVDYWGLIAVSPTFIEKAMLGAGNPLIYNKENMSYNQIKTAELTLFDETRIPWIVGYMDQNIANDINISISTTFDVVGEYEGWESYPYYEQLNAGYAKAIAGEPSFGMAFFYTNTSRGTSSAEFRWLANKQQAPTSQDDVVLGPYLFEIDPQQNGYKGDLSTTQPNWYLDTLKAGLAEMSLDTVTISTYIPDIVSEDKMTQVRDENDKVYKVGGKYYKIKVTSNSTYSTIGNREPVAISSDLGLKLKVVGNKMLENGRFSALYNSAAYSILYDTYGYTVGYEEVTDGVMSFTIPKNKKHTQNAPYDIFCIPYGMVSWGGSANLTKEYYGWVLAQTLIKELSTHLYDIQLLPYCPIRNKFGTHALDIPLITLGEDDVRLSHKPDGALIETTYTGLAWVQNSDFSFSLTPVTGNTTIKNALKFGSSAMEVKVASETDMFRLTSPNYNGQFEFSAQMNGGVQSFDVDCSYKPFQPYIRISPHFGGLYGRDFNDARGLICGGDFSLPQISEAWKTYQIQNKNYQEMFDRQLDSMDVQREVQRVNQLTSMTIGALSTGVTTGMVAGGAGGPVAGVVAGVASATVSAIGGARDYQLQEKLYNEARDYREDMFGYQMENIQARPTSLTKVSSFNPNNKMFPVLEYYTCTDTEKEALRRKILYNGMTVMSIGTFGEYVQDEPTYIKGRLIRLEDDVEDFHVTNAIASELYQGVFV